MMLQKLKNKKIAMIAVAALSVVGVVLYLIGKTVGSGVLCGIFLVIAVLFAVLLGWIQKPREEFLQNHRRNIMLLLLFPAALFLALEGLLQLLVAKSIIVGICSLLSAACIVLYAMPTIQCQIPPIYTVLPLIGLNAVRMLALTFGKWAVIPQVFRYCYPLYAMIAIMFLAYDLLLFIKDAGSRGRTVATCVLGFVLCFVSIFDGGIAILFHLAWVCIAAAELSCLLTRPRRRKRKAPAPVAELPVLESAEEPAEPEIPAEAPSFDLPE